MGFLFRFFFYGTAVSAVTLLFLSALNQLDIYKVVHNHTPGPCHLIPGIEHGSEDVDILPNGLAIFTTGLTFSPRQVTAEMAGLMTYNLSAPDEPAKNLQINGFKGKMNPHGLSIFLQSGKIYIYVINHPPLNQHPPPDTVEKFHFDVEKGVLNHEKTFTDPEFVGLNDLVVVGMDQFYASNFQTFKSPVLREIEHFLFFLPAQNVVYYDGKKASVVLPGMFQSNGLDMSTDKKFLYVSEVNKKRINSYRIESPTNLVLHDSKYLGALPDNINVNHRTGDLWIGAHPSMLQLIKRFMNPTPKSIAPSQVLRITTKDGKFTGSYEMFADDGHQIIGSSSAAYHKGKNAFVIGTVEHKAMYCQCLTCPK